MLFIKIFVLTLVQADCCRHGCNQIMAWVASTLFMAATDVASMRRIIRERTAALSSPEPSPELDQVDSANM